MNISIEQVQDAVKRARIQVKEFGVLEDAEAITSTLAALEVLASHTLQPVLSPPPLGDEQPFSETFAEWAAHFNLGNQVDHLLATLVYLRDQNQVASGSTNEIFELYKKARWAKPGNPRDVIATAIKRLYLTENEQSSEDESGKKRWQVTSTGYKYFQTLKKENS